ncbi:MAG: glycogen-binding domain-containing protein [Bryobacterales bacterium]|nr:glycogen-binding domain-containing protein [Bryobacterales bacterium]
MAKPKPEPSSELKPTAFTCQAADAKAVFLAGTFNNWDPANIPMRQISEGEWTAELELAPGRYEYKFIVDGVWCCQPGGQEPDSTLPDCVPNALGSFNREIHIE